MSTKKFTRIAPSINKGVYAVIRISEEMWWIKSFAKLSFEKQQNWYREATRWFDERPDTQTFLTHNSEAKRNDIMHFMAASLWGQNRKVELEEERRNQIVECWEGVLDDNGNYRPYLNHSL